MCQIDWDLVIKFLTFLVAAFAALKGLSEYSNNLKWKKEEFLSKQYSEFVGSNYVQVSFQLLDGFEMPVAILQKDGTNKVFNGSQTQLIKSLQRDSNGQYEKNEELTYFRFCLDKFLFKFGNFYNFYINELSTKESIQAYLQYWIEIIGNPQQQVISTELQNLLIVYIKENKFNNVIKLEKVFGYTI